MDAREDLNAWNAVAAFWHENMGEGNDFVEVLIWPMVRKLLPDLRGLRVLDVGCGNGLYARKLASHGARVTAIDYSSGMIAHARSATPDDGIEYRLVDATNTGALGELAGEDFDAVISTMVLMDMSEIGPLFRSLPGLLRPGGTFVFATAHPSFNSPHAHLEAEDARDRTRPSVRVTAYRSSSRTRDIAIRGQPTRTLFFHRPLSELLRPGFEAGLVLDALEEAAFPPDHARGESPASWGGRFSEFPAVLVGRFSKIRAGEPGRPIV